MALIEVAESFRFRAMVVERDQALYGLRARGRTGHVRMQLRQMQERRSEATKLTKMSTNDQLQAGKKAAGSR